MAIAPAKIFNPPRCPECGLPDDKAENGQYICKRGHAWAMSSSGQVMAPEQETTDEIKRRVAQRLATAPGGNGQKPKPARKTSWTVGELLAAEFPPPVWIVPDLVPVGLTILGGRPKQGKSFLALQLALAVASGGEFLKRKVQQRPVTYIALEDYERRLQERLRGMGAQGTENLRIETVWRPLHAGGLEDLRKRIEQEPGLFIIDTLARAYQKARFDWNDTGAVTNALAPLQELAVQHLCSIFCPDHHNKPHGSDADVVDDLINSTGKPGVADTILGLYRKRGERQATLCTTGREVDELKLALEWIPECLEWRLIGEAGQVRAQSVQDAVLGAIRDLGGEATVSEIADFLGKDKGNVSREISELLYKQLIRPVTRVGRKQPYRLAEELLCTTNNIHNNDNGHNSNMM